MNRDPSEFEGRAVETVRGIQTAICDALEAVEADALEAGRGSAATFQNDEWKREGGGGGLTRVLSEGAVIEKGGVNVSVVHGEFSEEFAERVPGSGREFFATGVSLVLHPRNPHAPTCHANFRHIVHGDKAWFGGGSGPDPLLLSRRGPRAFPRDLEARV